MYQDYRDVAEFYIVYIHEAHAADSSWPVPYAKEKGIKEHKNLAERCALAKTLIKEKKLTIPCLVDSMDNAAATAYAGWPDRIFLVRKNGRIGVAAGRGPWGFPSGLTKTRAWLAEYKKAGRGEDDDDKKCTGEDQASDTPVDCGDSKAGEAPKE